jgi:hypothetical protein
MELTKVALTTKDVSDFTSDNYIDFPDIKKH